MKNNFLKKLVNKSNLSKQKEEFEIISNIDKIQGGDTGMGLNGVCRNTGTVVIIIRFDGTCDIKNTSCNNSCN
jgi:hypothetical protein